MLTIVLWILGGLVGVVVLYLVVMVVWTTVAGGKPEGVEVRVVASASCRLGDDLVVEVHIRDLLGRARLIWSVDFTADYLKGFRVKSIEPPPKETSDGATLGTHIHTMERTIPPNGEEVVRFHCNAVAAGEFAGEVTVYVDSKHTKFLILPVRTVVR